MLPEPPGDRSNNLLPHWREHHWLPCGLRAQISEGKQKKALFLTYFVFKFDTTHYEERKGRLECDITCDTIGKQQWQWGLTHIWKQTSTVSTTRAARQPVSSDSWNTERYGILGSSSYMLFVGCQELGYLISSFGIFFLMVFEKCYWFKCNKETVTVFWRNLFNSGNLDIYTHFNTHIQIKPKDNISLAWSPGHAHVKWFFFFKVYSDTCLSVHFFLICFKVWLHNKNLEETELQARRGKAGRYIIS